MNDTVLKFYLLLTDVEKCKSTILYYSRLVVYVAILVVGVELLQRVPNSTIAALKPIILFVSLLIIQATLKTFAPLAFDKFAWFCQPGVLFLKSWTSLFFFAYLVQLPVQLSTIDILQILSWVFQVCLGNNIH
jgi:hypothetical protein